MSTAQKCPQAHFSALTTPNNVAGSKDHDDYSYHHLEHPEVTTKIGFTDVIVSKLPSTTLG